MAFLCLFLFSSLHGFSQVYYPAGMSNVNLATWLDASDATTITTGYVSTGATTTTTALGILFNGAIMPTTSDLRASLPIGSQLEVGTNTYTVTGGTATSLTVTPNITTVYNNQAIKRLGVSKWSDKSGTTGRDLQSPVILVNFTSTETTTTNEPSYLVPATGNPSISFINTGINATAQYLQGTGTAPYGITTNRSLAFVTQINSYSSAGGGTDGQGTYLFDRNPDPAGGTPLFSIKFEGNTLTEQIRDDAGNLANNASTISSPASGTFLNMSLIRSGGTDQFYNNGTTAGSASVSTGTSTMQPLCITYHAGDVNNSAQAQNLNMYEVILTNNTLSTTYRQLEEGYLAWKWGTQGNLSSSHPQRNAGQTGFTNDLVGIGRVSATDSVMATRTTNGLGLISATTGGFVQDNGDYLTAIDNDIAGAEDGSIVTVNGINRLNRVWYIQKTDASGHTGGTVTLYFDYSMLSNGVLPSNTIGSYSLIFHATNSTFPAGSTTTIAATATAIVGTQIQFTLNVTSLSSGYYTLESCNKSSVFDYAGTPYCTTGTASVTLLTGGGITASKGTFTISPSASITATGTNAGNVNLGASTPGTYTVTNSVSGSNGCTSTSTAPITIEPSGQWVGGVSTDWNTTGNWPCGSIPTPTSNITIPSGVTNYPIISSTGAAFVNNITIQSGATLTITKDTLNVFGIITSTSAVNATSGTIQMRGATAQSIGGSMLTSKTINNLIDSNTNTSGLTVSDSLYITGLLGFATGPTTKLATSNVLVLVSNATTTASVGQIAETGSGAPKVTITGNVTVQRYYPAHRRWRLVSGVPVQSSGAPTISASWQEGGQSIAGSVSNPNPGFGTHITGPGGAFVASTGYDQSPTNNPSIGHLMAANNWYTIANTKSTLITKYQGYMLFVRGDRSYPIYTTTSTTPATSTILRTTGTLNTGRITVPVNSGFTVVGNPYAATINFNNVYSHAATVSAVTSNSFSLWDPNIGSAANVANGTGGWVTLSWNGTSYDASPDPSLFDGFDVNGDIQSGAAFIVNGTGSGSVEMDESDKATNAYGNDLYLFRPTTSTTLSQAITPDAILRTTLYATDTAHVQTYLADGALNIFGTSYSDSLDWSKDVQKLLNLTEQISILKNSQDLSIERSALPEAGDTIYLSVAGLQQSPYQLVIGTTNFARPDIKAFLVDAFDSTSTPILLGDTSVNVNFTVTTVPGSYAANRFSIVFTATPPATVTYSNVTATTVQNKNIVVQWQITNQTNTKDYIVERSTDGTHFTVVDTTAASPTDEASYTYNWVDTSAVVGTNYYRIYTVGDNLAIQDTSNVASAVIDAGIIPPPVVATSASLLKVYPNPVTNGTVNIDLTNIPAGNYEIRIINAAGDVLLSETTYHGTNNGSIAIPFGQGVSAGVYILEMIDTNGNQTKIMFENQ
jgi:hypothetical protein